MSDRAFDFIPINARATKPRSRGLTEIRGPYYRVMGPRYLEDLLEIMHPYVDGLKFAGGRSGVWGTKGSWGRTATFQEPPPTGCAPAGR